MLRFILTLVLAATRLAAQSNSPEERTTSGAYTEVQAARGDTIFQMYCASCHELSFHTGDRFKPWLGRTLHEYFKVVKTTMPEDNPAGLTDDEYVRVVAYILKLNGLPAGSDSLVSDTLELQRIRIGRVLSDSTASRK